MFASPYGLVFEKSMRTSSPIGTSAASVAPRWTECPDRASSALQKACAEAQDVARENGRSAVPHHAGSVLWLICLAAIDAEALPGNRTPLPFVGGPHT